MSPLLDELHSQQGRSEPLQPLLTQGHHHDHLLICSAEMHSSLTSPPGCQLSSLLWLSGLLQPSPPPSDVYWFQYPLARERNSKIGIRLLGEQAPVSVKGRPAERPSERKAFSLDCFTNRAARLCPMLLHPRCILPLLHLHFLFLLFPAL